MSSNLPTPAGFNRGEPIPGYKTVNLLGRGGYGEVWRAVAPGGISKAIKIVFADGDDSHAEAELRALARIRDVRHPMLLSIERIEVVAGHLVIVTELADCSLKDHFVKLTAAQAAGVPQDELLKYIGDAADALDFLYASYSLQHLDVKPENILILGGRAKVGDFGLVKNLYERSFSLIGGLTPTYAPPELFEGRPTRHSDQYSLAIVYAHMLTGVLPFSTGSTAQLATQHLRGVPDLSALPKPQRSVIARALSKDPSHRFESCTALVDALRDASRKTDSFAATASTQAPPPVPAPAQRGGASVALPNERSEDRSPAHLNPELAPKAARCTSSGAAAGSEARPTILVGVGGAGVDVLARFLERLRDRFGDQSQWPLVECLAIDSDARKVSSCFREADLNRVRTVPIPLKAADSYGAQAGGIVRWLGRRWFYNIPRDLTTGGYRPLGRLALLTHPDRVCDAIAAVVSRAVEHQAATAMPRVIFVASICGGTGAGALLDLSYALRSELKRQGLSDEDVHGILLNVSPRSSAERDKARANAYATLSELHHFSRPGSHFPGEPALKSTRFHSDNAVFSQTHLLELGGCPGQVEWDRATDQVAEFVYGVAVTPASRLLEPAHGAERSPRPVAYPYDLLSLGAGDSRMIDEAVRQAQADVLRMWREGRNAKIDTGNASHSSRTVTLNTLTALVESAAIEPDGPVVARFAEYKLDLASLLADAAEVVELEAATDTTRFVNRLVDDCLSRSQQTAAGQARTVSILGMIDQYLRGDFREGLDRPAQDQFFLELVSRLGVRTRCRVNHFFNWIRDLVDSPDSRIGGARATAVAGQHLLQSLEANALTRAGALHAAALAIGISIRGEDVPAERSRFSGWTLRRKDTASNLKELLLSYANTCLEELLHRVVARIARILISESSTLIEQLDRLARDLTRLAGPAPGANGAQCEADAAVPAGFSDPADLYRQVLGEQLRLRRCDIACQIDEIIGRQLSTAGYGILRFLDAETELNNLLWRPLVEASRRSILDCVQAINCQLISACTNPAESETLRHLAEMLSASVSGREAAFEPDERGRMLIVPDEANVTALIEHLPASGHQATIVAGRRCDITLCRIGSPIPLGNLADQIIGGVSVYRELAGRLHTRADICWGSFDEAAAIEVGTASESDLSQTSTLTPTLAVRS